MFDCLRDETLVSFLIFNIWVVFICQEILLILLIQNIPLAYLAPCALLLPWSEPSLSLLPGLPFPSLLTIIYCSLLSIHRSQRCFKKYFHGGPVAKTTCFQWGGMDLIPGWGTRSYKLLLLLLFSCSVMSDSLRPHGLQHARLPCPSPSPTACSNWCPLSQWCHPTISSSVIPFSSCPQSFPASGLFKWVSSLHQVAKILEFQL